MMKNEQKDKQTRLIAWFILKLVFRTVQQQMGLLTLEYSDEDLISTENQNIEKFVQYSQTWKWYFTIDWTYQVSQGRVVW